MKSAFAFAALLLSLLAAPLSRAESEPEGPNTLYNPVVIVCCECVTIRINGIVPGEESGVEAGPFIPETDGSHRIKIAVTTSLEGICAQVSVTSVKIVSTNPLGGEIEVPIISPKGEVTDPNYETIITADMVRTYGDDWEVIVGCAGTPIPADEADQTTPSTATDCKKKFSLTKGCGSCSSCDEETGEPEVTENEESAEAKIPTTSSAGGMSSGSLILDLPDDGSFPGREGLEIHIPSTFSVTHDDEDLITGIDTGANTLEIKDGPGTDAFTITHKDLNGDEFRTTTLARISDGATQIFRMDSKYDGTTTRHERKQTAPGVFVIETGRVVDDDIFLPLRRQEQTKTGNTVVMTYRRKVEERASAPLPTEPQPGPHPWRLVSDIETTWEALIFGWKKTKEIIDPDGAALMSTWTYYGPGDMELGFDVGVGPGGFPIHIGRLRHHIRYDGYQAFHTYSLFSHTVTTPYAGNPAGQIVTRLWNPGDKTHTITTAINNTIVSKSVTAHDLTTSTSTRTVHTSAAEALVTTTHYKSSDADFGGRPEKILHSDGTLTTYAYTRSQAGGGYTTVTNNGAPNLAKTAVVKGTRTTTTRNSRGTVILSKTEGIGHGTASNLFSSLAVTSVDNLGRALVTAHHGTNPTVLASGEHATATAPAYTTSTIYTCCGISSVTDRYGVKTFYAYDGLRRRIKANTLDVTIETIHDGLITETHRYSEPASAGVSSTLVDDDANLISKSVRNRSGTLNESWSPDPNAFDVNGDAIPGALVKTESETTFAPEAGLSRRTVTKVHGGHQQTTDYFLDGRTASTTGALAPAMAYTYDVNPTGEFTTQAYPGGLEATTTQSDWAGRTHQTAKGTIVTDYHYFGAGADSGSKGKLEKTIDADGVTTLYRYNDRGEATTTAVKLAGNPNIPILGTDQITFTETVPAMLDGTPVWRTINQVSYTDEQNTVRSPIVSQTDRTPDGLRSWSYQIGQGPAPGDPDDTFTQQGAKFTHTHTTLAGNGNWKEKTTNPDGSSSRTTHTDGRMDIMEIFADGSDPDVDAPIASVSQIHDTFNRPWKQTDSRTGTTTTVYISATADFVASVTDAATPARVIKYAYDSRGRQITTTLPTTTQANIIHTAYTSRSEVEARWGSQTYPEFRTYDYAGRLKTLRTKPDMTGQNDSPVNAGGAVTLWKYSTTTGLLTNKFHDYRVGNLTDGPTYTYTDAGRLETRLWKRGVLTTYGYDDGGRLETTTYTNDPAGTPDATIELDALGRRKSVTNGIATSVFIYDPATLAIDTETVTYTLPDLDPFTRVLDRSRDDLGRDNGWKLGTGAQYDAGWIDENDDPDRENAVTYGYGTTDGRLVTVSGGGVHPPREFTYGYEPNSYNLLRTITGPAHIVTNTWETHRDVLTSKQNKAGTVTRSGYTYQVNDIGQRRNLTTEFNLGTGVGGNPGAVEWGYDPFGQITTADHTIPSLDRAYVFDSIGNRLRSAEGTTNASHLSAKVYTPNALNQYDAIGALEPEYDADGNATDYPLPANLSANSTLDWDGENRLISASVTSGGAVTFVYDALFRRIAETVGSNTKITVYDGWNPIAEYTKTGALTKTNLWGMDLSGTMQGAGGVGGLLAVTDSTGTYYPTYDGNGNVSEYLDSNGAVQAHYEYDPFGKTTITSGPKALDFSHRFSTKPLDATTGLYYYGYRWYDPATGRWPSRDPIEEDGGINMYGFVRNDGLNGSDYLGLFCTKNAWRYQYITPSWLASVGKRVGFYGVDVKAEGAITECENGDFSASLNFSVEAKVGSQTIPLGFFDFRAGWYGRLSARLVGSGGYDSCTDSLHASGRSEAVLEIGLIGEISARRVITGGVRGGVKVTYETNLVVKNRCLVMKNRLCVSLNARLWAQVGFIERYREWSLPNRCTPYISTTLKCVN